MPQIRVNLADVGEITNIDPGKHLAKLVGCEEAESSSGNPMLVWQWEIQGGEYDGREIRSFTSLQPHALFGLKAHLKAFGLDDDDVDLNTDGLVGKRAIIVVELTNRRNRNSGEMEERSGVSTVLPAPKKSASAATKKAAASKAAPDEEDDDEDNMPF